MLYASRGRKCINIPSIYFCYIKALIVNFKTVRSKILNIGKTKTDSKTGKTFQAHE